MTPDQVRAEVRRAEQDLECVRRELDEAVDAAGGHIDRTAAEEFARRLEDAESRRWKFRAMLRTPAPTAA